ncbi:hypothetical protein LUZ60_005814 [Juncus effusus]|nr:hypothetical protein LUZ60_005814 [Juncus effusus]
MQAYNAPFILRKALNLKDAGIAQQFITFINVTMESDKYICVRETSPDSIVVIIDMNKPMHPLRIPIMADSALMNPHRPPTLAFKARIPGTSQDHLQIFDIETNITTRSYQNLSVVFWKWISPKMLGLVTQTAVYHWSIEGELEPVKMFDRTTNLANNQIVSYKCDPAKKWLVLIGIAPGTAERPQLVKGNTQLFSVEGQRSQDLEAYAASFATFKVRGTKNPSSWICYTSKTASKLHIMELTETGRIGAAKMEVDMFYPPDFENDFPVGLQVSQMYGLIYIVTKLGLLFVYDLETATALYRNRISQAPIFLAIEAATSGGIYTINRNGQVSFTDVNEDALVSYIRDQLENRELAINIVKRANIRSRTDMVQQKIEELFAQKNYKEAAELAAESLNGILETYDAANSQLKNSLNEKAELERQLAESKTLLEITRREQEELQTERDNAVKERDYAFKKIELYRTKVGQSSSPAVGLIEFSYSELEEATNKFNKALKIGEGGFGSVYKGFLRHTTVAIKVLNHGSSQGDIEFNQEVEILTKVRHPNLIALIGASSEALALVYEFLPNGSLDTFLTNDESSRRKLSWQDRIRIASEICSALIFIHSIPPHGIAHGDLKPENILLDSNYTSKLADFGISRKLQQSNKTATPFHLTEAPKYTPAYGDPEFFSSYELTPKSDIYSFGVVLLQLVTGRNPRGLKDTIEEAMDNGELDSVVDDLAGKWPIEVAEKMASLGLWCSDPSRKRRPHLGKDVWPVIESMGHVAESTLKER